MAIQFGTDGWRAIIGEEYTYENVEKLIQAFCDLNVGSRLKDVLLGYDRRFSGRLFAEAAAQVLLGNGFSVLLSKEFCPTPCISWMTKSKKALAGVVITASHNPYQWNGVKFKESDGGSASPEYTAKIETRILRNDLERKNPKKISLEEGSRRGLLRFFDPHREYLRQLARFIDLSAIRKTKFKIVVDPIYGAGSGFFSELLGKRVIEIRSEDNPGFGGVNPEPIEKNLRLTAQAVLANRAGVGLATDGDADRIGAFDEKGRYVSSHQIFSLILRHLVTVRRWKGDIVKTVSATEMIERLGKKYGLNIVETPIGFKHICQEFRNRNVLVGGEESGGIGIPRHVCERDGILSGLLLLEIMAYHKTSLSKIIAGLQKEAGPLYFQREDFHLPAQKMEGIKSFLQQNEKPNFGVFRLIRRNLRDGFKYYFADGSWLLIRPSGTEPLLRVYAEAPSLRKTRQLIETGKRLLKGS
jgi:phosphomannomutase